MKKKYLHYNLHRKNIVKSLIAKKDIVDDIILMITFRVIFWKIRLRFNQILDIIEIFIIFEAVNGLIQVVDSRGATGQDGQRGQCSIF